MNVGMSASDITVYIDIESSFLLKHRIEEAGQNIIESTASSLRTCVSARKRR